MIKKETKIKNSAFDVSVISWFAPEYIRYQKGKLWKAVAAGAVFASVVIGILYNAWTFSLAVAAFAFAYIVINRETPKLVNVKISEIGIKVGERCYAYNKIKGFWIVYDPEGIKTLNLRVRGDLMLDIPITLSYGNPGEVRNFLVKKIPEMPKQAESFGDMLTRLFKI
ncbi:MAG: hypothetical protein ABIH78_05055 [Candidatus Peregrinibacteria bacterium]